MRKQNSKGRLICKRAEKCLDGAARVTCSVGEMYLTLLESSEEVKWFRCLVPLEHIDQFVVTKRQSCELCSDFLVSFQDGHLGIRECVKREVLNTPRVKGMLSISKEYWAARGINDWKIVTERSDEDE